MDLSFQPVLVENFRKTDVFIQLGILEKIQLSSMSGIGGSHQPVNWVNTNYE